MSSSACVTSRTRGPIPLDHPTRRIGRIGAAAAALLALLPGAAPLAGQQTRAIELTVERMVELMLSSSFRVRNLNLDIRREQYNLQAEQARLKSSVNLDLSVPAMRLTSEPQWNSTLQRNEIIRENTRMWEGTLSVRQPVILFGYPTNGYLSFNNRMYRYLQKDEGGNEEILHYNRYFVRYTQPVFQPNGLKNSLEQAELRLEGSELEFHRDVVQIVSDVSRDYYDLFEDAYNRSTARSLVRNMERALEIARGLAARDSSRAIEVDQIQVELANARERVQQSESAFRLRASAVRQRLGLSLDDSVSLDPVFHMAPVPLDEEEAVRHAMELTPRMRELDIALRTSELRLEETKGRGGFRMDLSVSYGRERQDELFDRLWSDPDNSYTLDVDAYLPIWDWGERKARIASSRIGIEQSRLRIEEAEIQIVSSVRNEVQNVREYETRTMAMRDNLQLARQVSESSFQRYGSGTIPALDMILSLRREADTADNFLDTYVGWREALVRLQSMTFFDFELGLPVLERYGIKGADAGVEGLQALR
ncbi:MAG: TolC family protein [Gemmatimonadetes bacterium]|nr:TolC family protein [Gemmatimonadota bacterium]